MRRYLLTIVLRFSRMQGRGLRLRKRCPGFPRNEDAPNNNAVINILLISPSAIAIRNREVARSLLKRRFSNADDFLDGFEQDISLDGFVQPAVVFVERFVDL
jgi:hypothetical protein